MALTDRVKIVGDLLIVTDCDGNTVQYEIPCTCEGDTSPPPDTTPDPVGDTCAIANYYARVMVDILLTMQEEFNSNPENLLGWNLAIGAVAVAKQLPLSPWVFSMSSFLATVTAEAAANRADIMDVSWSTQANYKNLVCIIFEVIEANFGIFDYEPFKTRMVLQGWYASGELIAAIPMGTFKSLAYLLSIGQPPIISYAANVQVDCDDCGGDVPAPLDCTDPCLTTTCYALRPTGQTNEFAVSGGEVIIFVNPGADACWLTDDGQPLRVDLGSNRCIKRIAVRMYTPCHAGGIRSNQVRFEIDDVASSNFACALQSTANYADCALIDTQTVSTTFVTPKFGRHIQIVGNREQQTIVQINIELCNLSS